VINRKSKCKPRKRSDRHDRPRDRKNSLERPSSKWNKSCEVILEPNLNKKLAILIDRVRLIFRQKLKKE
jgi:hypothetical protein